MPSYSAYSSGTYSTLFSGQKYYQPDGRTVPDHVNVWDGISDQDPVTKQLLGLSPMFFDALYEPRMAETTSLMQFYSSGHRLKNHYGAGVAFNNTSLTGARVEYSSYYEPSFSNTLREFSVVFVMQSFMVHNWSGTPLARTFFQTTGPGSTFKIQTYPVDTALTGVGDPASIKYVQDGGGLMGQTSINVNDGKPHVISISKRYADAQAGGLALPILGAGAIVEIYVDGVLDASINVYEGYSGVQLDSFCIGGLSTDSWTESPRPGCSVSHLAIYSRALPQATMSTMGSALSEVTGGGWHVFADGQWRKVLV